MSINSHHKDASEGFTLDDDYSLRSSHSRVSKPSPAEVSEDQTFTIPHDAHIQDSKKATYWNLLFYNRPYRLFILCHFLSLTGE